MERPQCPGSALQCFSETACWSPHLPWMLVSLWSFWWSLNLNLEDMCYFFSFSLISYLCFCKGVGSSRVHSWNKKALQGCYLGWDDRSGTATQRWNGEMRSVRLFWPSHSPHEKSECFVVLFQIKEHFSNPLSPHPHLQARTVQMGICTIDAGLASASKKWRLKSLWLSCNLWPLLLPPVLTRTDLNDIDSWINFLHEIMSARACRPRPLPRWPTEVLNNYISFQKLIWLRAIILVPHHHSCFHIFNIDIGKWKWTIG